ncbi:hypothetical protein D7231_17765 [Streptomyces klenkii]|uniref:Uncharacterized protein n=2 Tax=Streptomyces klenkii TaxID=1420899 RepID=A0A3B0BF83_9ACTN|nr:hypothetical protein D7231_17765 [Streptomyces klenkii]
MYGQTLGQLNRYFEQPVLTSYYLTAERLATELKNDLEGSMRKRIIEQVLEASAMLNGQPRPTSPPTKRRRPRKATPSKAMAETEA